MLGIVTPGQFDFLSKIYHALGPMTRSIRHQTADIPIPETTSCRSDIHACSGCLLGAGHSTDIPFLQVSAPADVKRCPHQRGPTIRAGRACPAPPSTAGVRRAAARRRQSQGWVELKLRVFLAQPVHFVDAEQSPGRLVHSFCGRSRRFRLCSSLDAVLHENASDIVEQAQRHLRSAL